MASGLTTSFISIDILASRLVFASNGRSHETSSNARSRQANGANRRVGATGNVQMYPVSRSRRGETVNEGKSCDASSSREHIIDTVGTTSEIEAGVVAHGHGADQSAGMGISKTVGFEITESRVGEGR